MPIGFRHSEATKILISNINKGKPATSGSFKKGHAPLPGAGNKKGFRHSEETIKKILATRLRGKDSPLAIIGRRQIGPLNPRWIKDRSLLAKRQERNDSAYKEWRFKVWLRDNFKCKINNPDCNGKIQAHHILSWKEYPELRYEINNGITLCRAHHPRKRAEEKRLILVFKELVSVSN
jgi:5-methylcytosine-specific restriction endonuclease McrA